MDDAKTEGARILAEIEAMSQLNETDSAAHLCTTSPPPWIEAVRDMTRRVLTGLDRASSYAAVVLLGRTDATDDELLTEQQRVIASRFAFRTGVRKRAARTSDGDRGNVSAEYMECVGSLSEEQRREELESRDELGVELHRRARHYRTSTRWPPASPRTHHAWIHRELAGKDVLGCKWCKEGER